MQPRLKTPITAILSRRDMRKFQIINAGRIPMVKSVMAAPTLYKYAISMSTQTSMHLPEFRSRRFQKWLTGVHWKMVKKKKSTPTSMLSAMAA